MAAEPTAEPSTRQRMLDALANRDSMVLTTGELAEMLDVDRKTIDYHKKQLRGDKIGVLSVGPADGMFLLTDDEPHIKGELARVAMPQASVNQSFSLIGGIKLLLAFGVSYSILTAPGFVLVNNPLVHGLLIGFGLGIPAVTVFYLIAVPGAASSMLRRFPWVGRIAAWPRNSVGEVTR